MKKKQMRILITGEKGLIGSKLKEKLSYEHEVEGYDKDPGFLVNIAKHIGSRYDLIIHTAAHTLIRECIKEPALAARNAQATEDILEYARLKNIKKIIVFSSSRTEHYERNPYIAAKIYSEELTKAYHECYGIEYIIIRPETVWGANDRFNRVINKWIKAGLKGENIVINGDKNKELSPIHVDDFSDYIMHVIRNWDTYKNKIIRISGRNRKAATIAKIIKNMTGGKSKIIFSRKEKTQPQKQVIGKDVDFIYCADNFEEKLEQEAKSWNEKS